jgi:hypothetical protein
MPFKKQILRCSLLFLLLPIIGFAQDLGYQPSKNDPKCKLADLEFQYPAYFKLKEVKGEENKTVFFRYKEDSTYIFVNLPDNPLSLGKETEKLQEKLLVELAPSLNKKLKWKKVENMFAGEAGKYEVKQEKLQAFDGKHRIFFQYHHLKYNSKNILVGFAFILTGESPAEAKEMFNEGLDAGSGPAGAGASTIIASITKEKSITVGMPPPPAAPPKVKN